MCACVWGIGVGNGGGRSWEWATAAWGGMPSHQQPPDQRGCIYFALQAAAVDLGRAGSRYAPQGSHAGEATHSCSACTDAAWHGVDEGVCMQREPRCHAQLQLSHAQLLRLPHVARRAWIVSGRACACGWAGGWATARATLAAPRD